MGEGHEDSCSNARARARALEIAVGRESAASKHFSELNLRSVGGEMFGGDRIGADNAPQLKEAGRVCHWQSQRQNVPSKIRITR
jgi:hypothetical protein